MTFHLHKKPSYVCISLRIVLALLLVSGFLPGTVSATPAKPSLIQEDLKNHENTQNDKTTLIVSKSEAFKARVKDYNLKSLLSGKSTDAFSDTMHLDALTKNLVKGKLDRNKQYIKKLQSGSSQNKQSIKRVRKVLTAAKTNPTRFNKLIATGNTSNSPVAHSKSGKQYIENQALAKLNKHSANERALAKAKTSNSKIVASHGRYKKVQKTGGIVGRVLSLWDAGQNAYYYDTKTKTTRFDTSLYLKNAAMSLSGLSGIVGAYKEGQKKGWLVGAYQGAKCIPLASDALNVYELTESSIGVVYDTLQSNRIVAENKGEQKRQGQEAVAKLKNLFSQVKDKESEFKTLQKKSSDLRKHFADLNKQYITVFSRLVASEQNLTSSDALLKAAEKAKPFMDASRINALKTDSEKVLLATATTIKLANATLTHHQTAGGNPENLNRTVEELKQMVAMLSARKAECEETQNAISPLLGGGEILAGTQKQKQQMAEDSQLSSQLYQQGRKLLQEHNDLIKKAKDLKTEQDTLLAQSKRLLSYYYRNGDPKTKTDLEIAFRNVVQYKIDDYSLGKLGEGQNTMAFTFRSWRKSITTSGEIPPDVAAFVQKTIFFQPDIDDLCKTLDTNLTTAQGGLNNLLNLKDGTAKSSNAKAKKYDSNHSRQKENLTSKGGRLLTGKPILDWNEYEISEIFNNNKNGKFIRESFLGFTAFDYDNFTITEIECDKSNDFYCPYRKRETFKIVETGQTTRKNGSRTGQVPYWIVFQLHGISTFFQQHHQIGQPLAEESSVKDYLKKPEARLLRLSLPGADESIIVADAVNGRNYLYLNKGPVQIRASGSIICRAGGVRDGNEKTGYSIYRQRGFNGGDAVNRPESLKKEYGKQLIRSCADWQENQVKILQPLAEQLVTEITPWLTEIRSNFYLADVEVNLRIPGFTVGSGGHEVTRNWVVKSGHKKAECYEIYRFSILQERPSGRTSWQQLVDEMDAKINGTEHTGYQSIGATVSGADHARAWQNYSYNDYYELTPHSFSDRVMFRIGNVLVRVSGSVNSNQKQSRTLEVANAIAAQIRAIPTGW